MFDDLTVYYTGHELDRLSHLRKDEEILGEKLKACESRVVPYWRGLHWLSDNITKQPELLSIGTSFLSIGVSNYIFLGEYDAVNYFGIDLSAHSESSALDLLPSGKFVDLRHTPILRRANLSSLLIYMRGLFQWHAKNQFCGSCGGNTVMVEAGHIRKCISCDLTLYPRIDPAVIVLIEYIPETGEPVCLLGRHRSGQPNMYSTLAGFVEIGESLEDAVKREMLEEVGLEVNNIRYVASQPWPFPSAVMLGFYAQTNSLDLELDREEVQEAQWFTAQEIKNLLAQNQLILSSEDSIARYLIQNWVNHQISITEQ